MKRAEEASLGPPQATSVDDVRRVRERLSAEFAGDVWRLGEYARKVGTEWRRRLGLLPASGQ